MQRQSVKKILGTQEPWVDFCTHTVYPGFLAHYVADVNQVEHVPVAFYCSAQNGVDLYIIRLNFFESMVNKYPALTVPRSHTVLEGWYSYR